MLAVDRRQSILEKMRINGSVVVSELAKESDVSEETIRRDLTNLEQQGLAKKTYGGAYIVEGMHRVVPVELRTHAWVEGKREIADVAASLVQNGDTIFLDSSTTVQLIAERILNRKNVIAITNGIRTAETLVKSGGIRVILTGGSLNQRTLSTAGRMTEQEIGQYFADKSFTSCDGLHLEHGITDSNEEEAQIRRKMIQQASTAVLVADATKFDRTSFVHMGPFNLYNCLITDRKLDDNWISILNENHIETHCGQSYESNTCTDTDSLQ